MLELRHLRALRAIAELRSFGNAAATLGYTQSAISHQIAGLERMLGLTLVKRPGGQRRVSLTEAGERLAAHAESILRRIELAERDMHDLAGERRAVRVGVFQSVAQRLLPLVLAQLRRREPRAAIELVERPGDAETLAMVEQGEIDLAFATLPVDSGLFAWRHLWTGEYVLMVASGARDANDPSPPAPAAIARLGLIGYRSTRAEHRVETHLAALGNDPQIVLRSDDNLTIQRLVGLGFGAAVVPELAVDLTDSKIAIRRPIEGIPPFILGLAWHAERELGPVAHAFIDTASDVCSLRPWATSSRAEPAS